MLDNGGQKHCSAAHQVVEPTGHPRTFLQVLISEDFNSNDLASADSTGPREAFFTTAHSKGLANLNERNSIAPPKGHEPPIGSRIISPLFLPPCAFFAFFSMPRPD